MESSDSMKRFFRDLSSGIHRRTWDEQTNGPYEEVFESEESSPMKALYGDSWSFIHGVNNGINLMAEDSTGREWQEAMNQFGYGAHGDGLRLGRRLAVYDEEREFTFVEPEETESKFTFVE